MRPSYIMAAFALMGMIACASGPRPTGDVTTTAAAIRAAQELGAGAVPPAKLHLQLAKEEAEQADALLANKQKDRASFVLMRAQADAEMAVALARDADMRRQAQQAADRVHALSQGNQ